MKVSECLIKIPPYYFFPEHLGQHQKKELEKFWHLQAMFDVARENDLDLTLLVYLKILVNLHKLFFRDAESKDSFLMDTKFYLRKLKNEAFKLNRLISF